MKRVSCQCNVIEIIDPMHAYIINWHARFYINFLINFRFGCWCLPDRDNDKQLKQRTRKAWQISKFERGMSLVFISPVRSHLLITIHKHLLNDFFVSNLFFKNLLFLFTFKSTCFYILLSRFPPRTWAVRL